MIKSNDKKLILLISIITMLCLGTIYSWSIFRKPLEDLLGISPLQSGLPYMFFLLFYSLFMPITGNIISYKNYHKIFFIGLHFLFLGWFLAGFSKNIYLITIFYGFLGGIGVGIIYGIPLFWINTLFNKNKGRYIGIVLAGFGLSPFTTAPIANILISKYGVLNAFKIFGLAFYIILFSIYICINSNCIKRYFIQIKEEDKKHDISIKLSKQFIFIWLFFFLGTFIGLTSISIAAPVGNEIHKIPLNILSLYLSIFALFNAFGRILYGFLLDKLYYKKVMLISLISITFAALFEFFNVESKLVYILTFSILWLNLGGWLSIAPTLTEKILGNKNFSKNYGYIFTAYGTSAITGTLLSGYLRTVFNSYKYFFIIILIIILVGIVGLILYKDNGYK
ncbi:MFS transporter [Caldicellulosiruptoraceae bacterium PP1]